MRLRFGGARQTGWSKIGETGGDACVALQPGVVSAMQMYVAERHARSACPHGFASQRCTGNRRGKRPASGVRALGA